MNSPTASTRGLKILVIKLGDLGDCLLATPALRALREAHPDAIIDLLAPGSAQQVFSGSDLINRHLILPRWDATGRISASTANPLILPALAGALSRRHYDVCIALQHLTTAAGIVKLAGLVLSTGAPRRIGLDNGRGTFFTDRFPDTGFGGIHEADYWLHTVSLLGADSSPRPTELIVTSEDRERAASFIRNCPRPLIALHPGSGAYSVARRWPVERFAEAGRRLRAIHGGTLIVIGNEAAVNGQLASEIPATDLTGKLSVGVLAAILKSVNLLVTNDSGILHVGAFGRAPIVAIFGLTDARSWGPYYGRSEDGARSTIVDVPLGCRPCLYRDHALGWREGCLTRDCLQLVSVEMVVAAANKQIDRFASERTGDPAELYD